MTTVVVAHGDPAIAGFIESTLRAEGLDVLRAADGAFAVELVRTRLPDVVLLDMALPPSGGNDVVRAVRSGPGGGGLPVIMLDTTDLPARNAAALAAGADDVVIVPFDTLDLVARVESTVRRNADMRAVSPLTGLPGNFRINEEIKRRFIAGVGLAVCHVDLDNFKAFNDRYGWMRGDEVILLAAAALKVAAAAAGPPPAFLGHVGGDDFVIVCTVEQAEPLCAMATERFDEGVRALHDPIDTARGFLVVVDRRGEEREVPLVTVSIGVATTARRHYSDYREIAEIAGEMKTVAKARTGSAVAVDRRTDGDPAARTLGVHNGQ